MSKALQAWTPSTLEDAMTYAEAISKSQLVPNQYRGKPSDILVAMQLGMELSLPPLRAMQNIAVINGKPSLWGDVMLGLVLSRPDCEDVVESIEGAGDTMFARCTVKRNKRSPVVRTFSVADAKAAGLWGRKGPWTDYRKRMLQMRARAFALRDAYADVLCGLRMAEEEIDQAGEQFVVTIPVDARTEEKEPKTKRISKRLKAAREKTVEEPTTEPEPQPDPQIETNENDPDKPMKFTYSSADQDEPWAKEEAKEIEQDQWETAQQAAKEPVTKAKTRAESVSRAIDGEATAYETMSRWISVATTEGRCEELGNMVPHMSMSDKERDKLREQWRARVKWIRKEAEKKLVRK